MRKTVRISLLLAILTGMMFSSFADRGIGKKKSRITINIKAPVSFNSSLNFNLRTGLKYTGSLVNTSVTNSNNFNTLVTYTKGNSVYILPYKQKVLVADVQQGYTGTKLIIRPR